MQRCFGCVGEGGMGFDAAHQQGSHRSYGHHSIEVGQHGIPPDYHPHYHPKTFYRGYAAKMPILSVLSLESRKYNLCTIR